MFDQALQYYLSDFCYNLKLFRKNINLGQREFSHHLNMSFRKYQRIESGYSLPDLADIINIAKTLNLTLDDLFFYEVASDTLHTIKHDESGVYENEVSFLNDIVENIKMDIETLKLNEKDFFSLLKSNYLKENRKSFFYISNWEREIHSFSASNFFGHTFGRYISIAKGWKNKTNFISIRNKLKNKNNIYFKMSQVYSTAKGTDREIETINCKLDLNGSSFIIGIFLL